MKDIKKENLIEAIDLYRIKEFGENMKKGEYEREIFFPG
jgi:hypothetical protein